MGYCGTGGQEMASKKTFLIPGSQKKPLKNAKVIAPAPADERLEVTVRLHPRNPLPKAQDLLRLSEVPLQQLTHAQYEERYGAGDKDIALVRKFAKKHNLNVVQESAARRSVILAGTVADFNQAFGVSLQTYAYPSGTYRGRTGSIQIPAELASVIEGVFGLDNRPVASRHNLRVPAVATAAHPFTAVEVAQFYNFPTGLDGTGQTIGIIELLGGYRPSDLDTYFSGLGLGAPTVIPVSVDGGTNAPSSANSPDSEVVLDIEVAGAVAPRAKIVVYFAPGVASNNFLDALTQAVHDTVNSPSVISISWGAPESIPPTSFHIQFDQALQAAAMLGITVCVAAGDNGAADEGPNEWDGEAHVDFPSASPFALSCGGTRLITANGAIVAESVWNQNQADVPVDSFGSSGGGVSGAFPLPAYQQKANVPLSLNPQGSQGRGVPDVAGAGDPATGYTILVDGQQEQVGGTSAVAPLWAGLIARINQTLNARVGFVNPQLYALAANSGAFRDITVGNNRVSYQSFNNVGYDAGSGWDACSGLGSPNGTKLASLLHSDTPDPWNLQQINAKGGLTPESPPAVSDPFASVFGNQQHIAYRDAVGWIWDSWYDGSWHPQQINGKGGRTPLTPAAVGGPFVWTVPSSRRQQHFSYRDQEGTIWDSWYNGHWNPQQINAQRALALTGPAAVAGPFASVFHKQQHIAYRDQEGTIWDSWYDGSWHLQHINGKGGRTDQAPAAVGGPFIWNAGSQQHFTYRDQRGTIFDSWYDGSWHLQQINAKTVLPTGPPTVGDPCAVSFGSQQHIFYRDNEGTIWDSWYTGSSWSLQQINKHGGVTPAPAAAGDPFVCLFGKEQMHVSYRDGVGAIWDSWYDASTSRWNLQKINAGGVTKGPAAVGGPFVWTVSGSRAQQHFTYRDQRGTIFDSWYDSPAAEHWVIPLGLYIGSVTLFDSSGSQIPAPIAGEPFTVDVNIVNGGGAGVTASTLTFELSASDNSSPKVFTADIHPLSPGGGASASFPISALTAGLRYDFNFYDPTTTQIGYESFPL